MSATTSTPRTAPSQPTAITVRPACSARSTGVRQRGVEVQRPLVGQPGRAPGDDGVPVDDARARRAPRWRRTPPTGGRSPTRSRAAAAMAAAIGCSEASSSAPASRSSSSSPTPAAGTTSTRLIRPVVTVPVLSSTTVSTRRVDSSTCGPLIRMPSWAPRPVPTSSAVGVASPSAQGQAMISTATAAVNAAAAPAPAASQNTSVATARAITTGTNTAETRSASRCTGALPVCAVLDQAGDLRQLGVGADPGGPHDQPAAGVDRGAGDLVAGADLDRHRLAGEHARRRPRRSPRRPRRRWRSSRRAGPRSGRRPRSSSTGIRCSRPLAQHRDVLGAQLQQRRAAPPRSAAWPAPRGSGRRG